MLCYTGSFKSEADSFSTFDGDIVSYIQKLVSSVELLNDCWHDDVSSKKLGAFNDELANLKKQLDNCHAEVHRYFQDIANLIKTYGANATVEMPDLGEITYGVIKASSTDGSFEVDDEQILQIVREMEKVLTDITFANDTFKPEVVALAGSSQDVIDAVQSNLDYAAKSYKDLEGPIAAINKSITETQEAYAKKRQSIAASGQNA